MDNSSIKLFYGVKERLWFFLTLFLIFLGNLLFYYYQFYEFKKNEIVPIEAVVKNIYLKEDYTVLKLEYKKFDFFTSISLNEKVEKFDKVYLAIITTKISFIEYLKDFYAPTINFQKIGHINSFKNSASNYVSLQHESKIFKELFNALFFAIPISKELREICANFGISHLIAISGFHLGVISFVMYWIFYFPYTYLHKRYFSYRNKKYDILCITAVVLLFYLLFTSMVPSFLRAFVMFILGLTLLRNNIKLFSFETLLVVILLILAFFPKYIFSVSLWFSISGVFYIFLFFEYFKNLPKVGQFFLFNAWIYLAMNPITNYVFGTTSYLQLFSSFLTLFFTVFYPVVAVLHLIGVGDLFDKYLLKMFSLNAYSSEVLTPLWFFSLYVVFSLLAIKKKVFFVLLNIMLVGFTLYIFYINNSHY